MKLILIGIYDRKAQMFISLEPTPNINVAIRTLTEIVNRQQDNTIYKWPEDYALYELGTFDNETGLARARMDEEDGETFNKKLIIECESLKQRS